ncbi:MAG TPA: class I SAM-dependent methyltransferase [Chitinophagaceae bacterium]|jgi:cyclopropane fatty-acyl-phospholipid synthase-like methyltransferase|nr:class I SAM-dependent methyltransferase [Chitinophagaceae bacterium]
MQSSKAENINNIFFDGYYKQIWRGLIPEGLTKAEIDFVMETAGLRSGSKVLDLMCGYGRHALALARKGIEVTAVDNLADYVYEVKEIAEKENLLVSCIQANVIEFRPVETYDLVLCLGNNLSFFNEQDIEKLFSTIASHTKKGGLFISNTWTIAEIVFKNFTNKSWSEVKGLKYLSDSKIFFSPSRIETEVTIVTPNGLQEIKAAIDYIYSLNEIESMLKKAGFLLKETWSIPGKKKFAIGEPRAYLIAEKI